MIAHVVDGADTRTAGILALGVGLAGLASLPVLPVVAAYHRYSELIVFTWLASAAGAFAVTWGALAVSTGRWRVLTPLRAFAVPAVLAVSWLLRMFVPTPQIDPLGAPWTPPTLGDLSWLLGTTPAGAFLGGAVATAIGTAVAREQRTWAAGAAGLTLLVALNMGRLSGHPLGALLVVAAFGAVPAGVGYALAAPWEE